MDIKLILKIEYKYDIYRGKDFTKKFCEFLREHAMEMIFLMKLLKERQESYENVNHLLHL